MTKLEAAMVLIAEARIDRRSLAAAKRIARACDQLEFFQADRLAVFQRLEYADKEGKPWAYGKHKPGVAFWELPE